MINTEYKARQEERKTQIEKLKSYLPFDAEGRNENGERERKILYNEIYLFKEKYEWGYFKWFLAKIKRKKQDNKNCVRAQS